MNSSADSSKTHRVSKAFTLVETVIAIGIVSTVMVALLGMMPEGMNMISQAGQRTVGARIAQELVSQIQLADFDELSTFDNKTYYFDDQGTEVTAGALFQVYTARIEVSKDEAKLPGGAVTPWLKNVVIKVTDRQGEVDFGEAMAGRSYLRYATNIVNLEDKLR